MEKQAFIKIGEYRFRVANIEWYGDFPDGYCSFPGRVLVVALLRAGVYKADYYQDNEFKFDGSQIDIDKVLRELDELFGVK